MGGRHHGWGYLPAVQTSARTVDGLVCQTPAAERAASHRSQNLATAAPRAFRMAQSHPQPGHWRNRCWLWLTAPSLQSLLAAAQAAGPACRAWQPAHQPRGVLRGCLLWKLSGPGDTPRPLLCLPSAARAA